MFSGNDDLRLFTRAELERIWAHMHIVWFSAISFRHDSCDKWVDGVEWVIGWMEENELLWVNFGLYARACGLRSRVRLCLDVDSRCRFKDLRMGNPPYHMTWMQRSDMLTYLIFIKIRYEILKIELSKTQGLNVKVIIWSLATPLKRQAWGIVEKLI